MAVGDLVHRVRRPESEPEGALVLLHGRGADENDLWPLLALLDPARRLLGVTPRGPLSLPPGGAHWYVVRRVGFPDPGTFRPTFERTAAWLDDLAAHTGVPIERMVLGGFSQGAVMSYALSLGAGRPRPAGLLALSGFVPQVPGFDVDLGARAGFPVAIGHGVYDDVISVEFSRTARALLEDAGADVVYRESPMPHAVDPAYVRDLTPWVARVVEAAAAA